MSTTGVGTTTGLNATNSTSTNLNLNTSGSTASITGLASGLDTTAIISEIISLASAPMLQLQVQEQGVQAQQTELHTLQTSLTNLSADAANLSSPTLFDTSEAVTSSNPTLIAATSQTGAGVGGYQVSVTQLANSAQRTFTYASPSSADTVTIDGHTTQLAAGASIQDFVSAINNDPNATVYAAATDGSTVVLSNRTTGDTGSSFIQVSDPGGALTEQTALAKQGQNAEFSVDGVSGTASSNTVTNAIAGVTLTLGGLTSTNGPVTINVAAPAANPTTITTAINQFVSDYNSFIGALETQLTTTPVNNPANATQAGQGTLYNDQDLGGLLNSMRQLMYTGGTGLPTGMAALSDIGITTGAASGNAAPTASSLAGDLTVDTTTLDAAIKSNPSGVQAVLAGFSQSFQTLVNTESGPGGVIDQRVQDDTSETTQMSNQIATMQASLNEQQTSLQNRYATLESTLSTSQAQESALQSEIASL
jgi:flagellar hook-associated protein 2